MECSNKCTVNLPGPSLARCGGTTFSLFMLFLEQLLRTQCDIEDPCGQIKPPAKLFPEYDFIVVGGGSAGSVVASRLSEIPYWKVLLIEAGVNEPISSQVPSLWLNAQNTSVDWQYYTEPEPSACLSTGGSCRWPRGKVIGGSSVLNNFFYVRGNRMDYDNWERLGNTGWSYNDVLPYFLKSENNLQINLVDKGFHSVGGYLPITQPNYHYPIEKDVLRGVRELGLQGGDFNGKFQTRFMLVQTTTKNGIRYSNSRAFLRPVHNRPNLHVLLNTTVTRVLVHPLTKQAYGVEVITTRGKRRNFLATKEVIVSGGTINSPQILMLSGIGDQVELKKVNVPVVHHLPGVGKNLQNHPSFLVYFYVNDKPTTFLNQATVKEYLSFRKGPLSSPDPAVVGFIHTKYANSSQDYPDVEIQIAGYLAKCSRTGRVGEIDKDNTDGVVPKRRVSISALAFQPKSRGYLTLRDNDPLSHPKLYPMYLTAQEDLATLIEGIKFCLRLSRTKALQKYGFELDRTPVTGCENKLFGSDEYWECAIRTDIAPENHQVGTCKMGPDSDPEAVVDPRLRVRGVKQLRVVDASVMTVIPVANTNAPTTMIAEKASDIIKECWLNNVRSCW